jgi:hypothetical protein
MSDASMFGIGLSHHYALLVAYAITMLAWDRVARRTSNLWPTPAPLSFVHPWREVGFFAIALVLTLGIGQLFVHKWLLPSSGPLSPLVDALNQLIIFAPIVALPLVRRQGWASAWLPSRRVWARILAGLILSLIASLVFTSVRTGSMPWIHVLGQVYHPKNAGNLVQVLCEDVAIAILFVRLRAALGLRRTIVAVAVLFAAAHIPALLANGASLGELSGLVLDAGLGVLVLFYLQRSGDVWWFWWVHFAMDMMQFYAVPGAGT